MTTLGNPPERPLRTGGRCSEVINDIKNQNGAQKGGRCSQVVAFQDRRYSVIFDLKSKLVFFEVIFQCRLK